jgi:hypothetical protein
MSILTPIRRSIAKGGTQAEMGEPEHCLVVVIGRHEAVRDENTAACNAGRDPTPVSKIGKKIL